MAADGAEAAGAALADIFALGLPALAEIMVRTADGIAVLDGMRNYVYGNPAACQMLGYPLPRLRGRALLSSFPLQEHATVLAHFPPAPGIAPVPFSAVLLDAEGAEREVVCSVFAVPLATGPHAVLVLQDLTGIRAAARTATALAQTTALLAGTGTVSEILAGISRHAVEGTRAVSAGTIVVSDDQQLNSGGGWGARGADYGNTSPSWNALRLAPAAEVIAAMTGGAIVLGATPGKPVLLPDARTTWEASPIMKEFAATKTSDWQGAVCAPLSWGSRLIGILAVYLPSGLAGPSEAELAFYTTLADQAAVAVINARLTAEARAAAALVERARLARELHDSVSQALFSMAMHARAAQLSLTRAGLDDGGALSRSVAQLSELTAGALAEMRALIFELRPGALAEEGLVSALRKQAAAVAAREQLTVTVDDPAESPELDPEVEEHLYRIISEALHNVVKHAQADHAAVGIVATAGTLTLTVADDGDGFDPAVPHPGHLGLSTMAQRAELIGAELTVVSAPGQGTTVTIALGYAQSPDESGSGRPE